jgi:Uma2 family endonuclease
MTALADLPETDAETPEINLPGDGNITCSDFDALPKPPRGWAWELQDGRLELNHMPVSFWHSEVVRLILDYWLRLGHVIASEQYVANSGFIQGGTGKNNYVADGVVFTEGHTPKSREARHDAAVIHAVVEAVSDRSEEKDAIRKFATYAELGIQHYWIIRDTRTDKVDGVVTMHELIHGTYRIIETKLVSELAEAHA